MKQKYIIAKLPVYMHEKHSRAVEHSKIKGVKKIIHTI